MNSLNSSLGKIFLTFFLTSSLNILLDFNDSNLAENRSLRFFKSTKLDFSVLNGTSSNFSRMSCFTSKYLIFMRVTDTLFDLLITQLLGEDNLNNLNKKNFTLIIGFNELLNFFKNICKINFKIKTNTKKKK